MGSWINDGVPSHTDFLDIGLSVGDRLTLFDTAGGTSSEAEVVSAAASTLEVYPDQVAGTYVVMAARSPGTLRISNIPGGILEPTTPFGEIEVEQDQVHIGGALDVFIRAGFPQEREVNLDAIRDDQPLHFGLDLESFGEDDDELINITVPIASLARVPTTDTAGNALTNRTHVFINTETTDGGEDVTSWYPTEKDVGRYIQMMGPNDYGTFEITAVHPMELDNIGGTRYKAVRVEIDTNNLDDGTSITDLTASASYTEGFRIREKVSVASRVRDRAVPVTDFNGSGDGIGASVGDSVIVETGDDAGIFTIRRILDSADVDDLLILDRDLTKTVTPSGLGDNSGLRYRIADELDIDLVEPRVTKIPLGGIFTGTDLNTVAGSNEVNVSGGDTNFLLAGVEAFDILEILEGDNRGTYPIQGVTGTTLVLSSAVSNTLTQQRFSVYTSFSGVSRPVVRVKELELLDSSSRGTGITIPYGNYVDARVLGRMSNRDAGRELESYSGETTAGDTFEDAEADFTSAGIMVGYRMSILSGDNAGNYTVKEVTSSTALKIIPESEGGKDFVNDSDTNIHYALGLPSVGYLRVYFLEPTSAEISTGVEGGVVSAEDGKEFKFSETDGYLMIPEYGSDDPIPQDIRVVRSWYDAGETKWRTIFEITGSDRPDVYGMELVEGDLLEVNEQIPFRDSNGALFPELERAGPTFAGIAGDASGIHTLTGSNLVRVPTTSLVDFSAMDTTDNLVGQYFVIESGPDAGRYIIEEVVDAKTLRLSQVMTGTTENYWKENNAASDPLEDRDAKLYTVAPGYTEAILEDLTDGGSAGIGTQVGHYITIFEAERKDIEGTWEITAVDTVNNKVTLDMPFESAVSPIGPNSFSWIRTALGENVEYKFKIYKSVPAVTEILEVATKEPEIAPLSSTGEIVGASAPFIRLNDAVGTPFSGVQKGDRLEIMVGDNVGVYTVETKVDDNNIEVYTYKPFPVKTTGQVYRVWAGVHGSRTMVTTREYGTHNGLVPFGEDLLYQIRRGKVFRMSSTEMEENFDGSLYYFDIPIESEGTGDDWNLEEGTRMLIDSGISVDGYTYSVLNNTLTFSAYERVSISTTRRFLPIGNSDSAENMTEISGRNLKVTYETSTVSGLIDDLLRSDSERPVNANPIARHFLPSYLLFSIYYQGGPSEGTAGSDLEDYVNSLGPEDELEVSDLEALLTRRGATYVRHPLELVSVTHDLDRDLVVERSEDKIGGTTVPYNGTARISSFFAKTGEGLNVVRE